MIYVTSDLHGIHPEVFRDMLQRAGFTDRDFLFILGDVIDRGEYGIELLTWISEQTNMQLILGNHEDMLLGCAFVTDEVPETGEYELSEEQLNRLIHWQLNGGSTTVAGLKRLMDRSPEQVQLLLEYLMDAPVYEELEISGKKWILCHSGIGNFSPAKPMSAYSNRQLTWCRPELTTRYFEDATVVFGHTPTLLYGEQYRRRAIRTDTWICIDTGAAFGDKPMLLRLDDEKEFYFD